MTTPILMTEGELPLAATALYTVPTGSRVMLKDFDLSNTTAGALLAYVYLVPSGDSPTTSNLLVPGSQIEGLQIMQWSGTQVLEEGDALYGKASAAGVNLRASGGEDRV